MNAQEAFEIVYDASNWYRDNEPDLYAEALEVVDEQESLEYDELIANSNVPSLGIGR